MLESPQGVEGFQSFSLVMFSQVVSSRYWETQEMASFILRQVEKGLVALMYGIKTIAIAHVGWGQCVE